MADITKMRIIHTKEDDAIALYLKEFFEYIGIFVYDEVVGDNEENYNSLNKKWIKHLKQLNDDDGVDIVINCPLQDNYRLYGRNDNRTYLFLKEGCIRATKEQSELINVMRVFDENALNLKNVQRNMILTELINNIWQEDDDNRMNINYIKECYVPFGEAEDMFLLLQFDNLRKNIFEGALSVFVNKKLEFEETIKFDETIFEKLIRMKQLLARKLMWENNRYLKYAMLNTMKILTIMLFYLKTDDKIRASCYMKFLNRNVEFDRNMLRDETFELGELIDLFDEKVEDIYSIKVLLLYLDICKLLRISIDRIYSTDNKSNKKVQTEDIRLMEKANRLYQRIVDLLMEEANRCKFKPYYFMVISTIIENEYVQFGMSALMDLESIIDKALEFDAQNEKMLIFKMMFLYLKLETIIHTSNSDYIEEEIVKPIERKVNIISQNKKESFEHFINEIIANHILFITNIKMNCEYSMKAYCYDGFDALIKTEKYYAFSDESRMFGSQEYYFYKYIIDSEVLYSLYKYFEETLTQIIHDTKRTPTHHVRERLKEMGKLPDANQ